MAVINLTDAFCYCEGYDFTTDTNNATLTSDAAQLDATTFGSGGWQELAMGLKTTNLAWSGFWQAGNSGQSVDSQAFSALDAASDEAYTIGPVETESWPVYMFEAQKSQYTIGGQVGEITPFTLAASVTDGVGMARGMLAKARGTVSATGQLGQALNLGALSSTQYLYATFHAFVAGTTITVTVESDSASNFPSPTTLATLGPFTASGGTWMPRVAGPITDTWYRLNVTAITGTFTVAGAIGLR